MSHDALRKLGIAVALTVIVLVVTGCQTYEVQMSYECTFIANTTVGLTCGQWVQTGGVQTPNCFPASATVITPGGPKTMSELRKGDDILGFDHATGKPVFSTVRAWLHRDPAAEVRMSTVLTDSGMIVASSRHSIAVQGGEAYKFAADLVPHKDTLLAHDGSSVSVLRTSDTTTNGLFAPLTGTSNFFVGGPGEGVKVLAHNFAQLDHPQRYEGIFQRFFDVAEFFWPSISDLDESGATPSEAYIHPVARLWMRIANIPTTQDLERLSQKRTIIPNGKNGFDDIPTPEDDELEGRQLSANANAPARRLDGGGGDNDNELMVILFSVVQVMPPFLRHQLVPLGTPGYTPGYQMPQPTVDIKKWVEEGVYWSTVYGVISGSILGCCMCCYCCLQVAAGGGAAE